MGTFATTSSLQTLMPGVSFDAVTTSLCSICITWAESLVRTSLARRYDMSASPFNTSTTIPTMVTSITEQIAIGHYFKLSSRGAKEALNRGQAMIDQGKADLKDILESKVNLLDNSFSPITDRLRAVVCSTSAYNTTFNEDNPLHWKVDTNKLSDISDERDAH